MDEFPNAIKRDHLRRLLPTLAGLQHQLPTTPSSRHLLRLPTHLLPIPARVQQQMGYGDVQLLVDLSSRATEDLESGLQIMLLGSLDYYSLLGLIQAGGRGHWVIINGPHGSMRMLMPFFKPTDLLECSIECLHWFCFNIFQWHRIKQEHSSIADTRTTNPVPTMKIYHHGHNSFFVFLNHSKICLQHPLSLLRLGVKGAVLCLV